MALVAALPLTLTGCGSDSRGDTASTQRTPASRPALDLAHACTRLDGAIPPLPTEVDGNQNA